MAMYRQTAAGKPQPAPQNAGAEFVKQALPQIAEEMTKVAKVVQVEHPQLMPLLVRAAGAMKVFEQEFNKASQGAGKSVPVTEPTTNGSEGQANIGA